jgi:F-type H+-transporting ATPase subunit c
MKKYTPLAVAALVLLTSDVALAQDGSGGSTALGAGMCLGLAALGGAIGQGNTVRGYFDGVSRNPQAVGMMTTNFYVGMALIESLVLVAFGGLFLLNS